MNKWYNHGRINAFLAGSLLSFAIVDIGLYGYGTSLWIDLFFGFGNLAVWITSYK